jgi:hypothetical protein
MRNAFYFTGKGRDLDRLSNDTGSLVQPRELLSRNDDGTSTYRIESLEPLEVIKTYGECVPAADNRSFDFNEIRA